MGVRDVLDAASLDKGTKNPPDTPRLVMQSEAEELSNLLNSFADATDQLQADSCTSNLVILAVVKSYERESPLVRI